jgi:hypothetical protein
MKKLFVALTLLAFIASSALVFALDPAQDKPGEPKIKCCFQDGQCLETRRENCALKQGVVVQDCKDWQSVGGEKDKQK